MTNEPMLIETFLIDGTLEGARIVDPAVSAVKAIVIPRLKINTVKNRKELTSPCLYFLTSKDEDEFYIGKSENFGNRVDSHIKKKDFWDTAIVFVSTGNKFNSTEIAYLESITINQAKSAENDITIKNSIDPNQYEVSEYKVPYLKKSLEDIKFILTYLGYSVFSSKTTDAPTDNGLWYAKTKQTNATARYMGDKFIVLTGSLIDKSYAPSLEINFPEIISERNDIFNKYGIDRGSVIELTEDVSFRSPNHAGKFVTGGSVNAWHLWKNKVNQDMDEVVRKDQ